MGGFRAVAGDDLWFAVTGAWGRIRLAGREVDPYEAHAWPAGAELHLDWFAHGARAYLAVRGGFDGAAVLGSRATDLLAGLGPARACARAMSLDVGARRRRPDPGRRRSRRGERRTTTSSRSSSRPGPRADWFAASAQRALFEAVWTVSNDADRVGVRLDGPRSSACATDELPSEGMVPGALQVPPSGRPTILLADGPVTGGYPVIAVVTDAALDLLAQARPGTRIRFRHAALSRVVPACSRGPGAAHQCEQRLRRDRALARRGAPAPPPRPRSARALELARGDAVGVDLADRVEVRACGRVNASTSNTPIRRRIAAAAAASAPARRASPWAAATAHSPSRPYAMPSSWCSVTETSSVRRNTVLRLVDLAAQQAAAEPIWLPADRPREQVAARLGHLGRPLEVRERFVAARRAPTRRGRARRAVIASRPAVAEPRAAARRHRRSSRVAVAMSGSGSCTRAVARAASAMAAASSSPLSANSRTHSPSPATTSVATVAATSRPTARRTTRPHGCAGVIGCSLPSSSSIHTRTSPKSPDDPPVDEQTPREVAGVVEAVGVDEVADRGAEVRRARGRARERRRPGSAPRSPGRRAARARV